MDAQKAHPERKNPMSDLNPNPVSPSEDGTTPGTVPVKPAPLSPTTPSNAKPRINGLRPTPDFTAGEGKEMTGMSVDENNVSRPTYSSADSLYGKAKPSIDNTIANTPVTADPNKPVMIQGQSMDERRGAYQQAAGKTAAEMQAPPPREIPAIQPTPERQIGNTGSRSDSEDFKRARESKAAREGGTMGDYFNSQGNPEMAKAFPNRTTPEEETQKFGRPLGPMSPAPAPSSSRVVSQRPATPEELKARKPLPVRR
jgi:hypothetical protein